jgi:hypothetical protein
VITIGLLGTAWILSSGIISVVVGRAIKRADQYVNLTEHCECGCELTDWRRGCRCSPASADDLRRTA